MTYQMKALSCNPAGLKGLSEKLIVSHYENNYGGAVKRLNAITEQLQALDYSKAPVYMINGIRREELIAMNSMILHELYFDSLGVTAMPASVLDLLTRDFASVARANALEDNVSLYYTQNGRRHTLNYVDAPIPRNTWHTLRVEFSGKKIRVLLNGKVYIEMEDDRIAGAGAIGVWTKADSVTAFDDFSYGAFPSR